MKQYYVEWFNGDEMTLFFMKATDKEASELCALLKNGRAVEEVDSVHVEEIEWLTFAELRDDINS